MNDVNDRFKFDNHDCSDDVPCSARFLRSGAVGTFGTSGDGLDVIQTQAELTSVFGVMTHRAKVVDAVEYCAGGYNTPIVGCGRCNAFGYIVEDWALGTATADGTASRVTIYSNNEGQNFPTATVDGELLIQNGGELILD